MANEMDSDEDEFRGRQGRPNQRAIADKDNDAVSELGDNSVSIITTVLTHAVKWTKSYPSQDSEEEDSLPDKKKKATSTLFGNSDTLKCSSNFLSMLLLFICRGFSTSYYLSEKDWKPWLSAARPMRRVRRRARDWLLRLMAEMDLNTIKVSNFLGR